MNNFRQVQTPCEKCRGGCCTRYRVQVTGDDDVPWEMIYVRANAYWMRKKADRLTCVALGKDGHCTIYNERPQTCKDFEVGESRCIKIQAEQKKRYQYA